MRIKKILFTFKMPKRFDTALHFSVLVLVFFGTLMIVSTNAGSTGGPLLLAKVFAKQMVFVLVSYGLLTFFANNFTMKRAYKWCKYVGVILFIALLSTQLWEDTLGSKAWIHIPVPGMEVTIQPAEFAKIFMIVIMAVYIELAGRKNFDFWTIIKTPFTYFVIIFIAIILQKDIGTMLVLLMIIAICFLIPSHVNLRKFQRIVKIGFVCGGIGAVFMMTETGLKILEKLPVIEHVAVRVQNAINPFDNPYSGGYQLINGLYSFARGGVTGVGLGESIQKYGYLTQSDNDFILSIVVEELGIFGLGIVVLGYGLIIQRLFYYAIKTKSEGYKIILIGTSLYVFIHFFLNVGGVSGLIPLTGVPLLFISSGGSSLMSISIAIGISQAVISRIRRQGGAPAKRRLHHKKEPQGDGTL